jgi:NAD(P)-dependent dehydrogenase (short-subunit alcohol dehydrogenase family)
MERRFAGKVALVTGGSSGIGRATALAFAREGAAVVVASRGVERGEGVRRELEALGAAADFFPTDVSQADQVEALVQRTVARFGRLDCAFNNAASIDAGVHKPSAEFTEEDFDGHVALNLKSVWLCMKQEILQMLAQGTGGAIVNTSSVNGLGGVPGDAFYAMSKAGVLAVLGGLLLCHRSLPHRRRRLDRFVPLIPAYFRLARRNSTVRGQACCVALRFAPSRPSCARRKPWPAPS